MDALKYQPEEDELTICANLLRGDPEVIHNFYKGLKTNYLVVRDMLGVYQFIYKASILPKQELFVEQARTNPVPRG